MAPDVTSSQFPLTTIHLSSNPPPFLIPQRAPNTTGTQSGGLTKMSRGLRLRDPSTTHLVEEAYLNVTCWVGRNSLYGFIPTKMKLRAPSKEMHS